MNKLKLETDKAPAAIGPYSQAIHTEDMIYISGQLPIDPVTGEFGGDMIQTQTLRSLQNIKEILNSENMDMQNVVKTTVLLKNMDDFDEMNKVYAQFFEEPYPARAAFQVAKLPKDALIEIEAIAVK